MSKEEKPNNKIINITSNIIKQQTITFPKERKTEEENPPLPPLAGEYLFALIKKTYKRKKEKEKKKET